MKFVCLILIVILFSACGGKSSDRDGPGLFSMSDDRDQAVVLIEDANNELKRIRILYRENNSKVAELKTALTKNDIQTVKRMSDDLLLVILDGYALAESAKEKLEQAERLNINEDFKYYLRLKEESLTLQIKAFDYRRESAKLFRDKFGTDDKVAMADAAKKFKENEANFEKYMAQASKVSEEADKLAKEVNNRNK